MELFLFLTSMIQKFEFRPNPDDDTWPEIENVASGGQFCVPSLYKVVAKERGSWAHRLNVSFFGRHGFVLYE